jgi:hypothetical protein
MKGSPYLAYVAIRKSCEPWALSTILIDFPQLRIRH